MAVDRHHDLLRAECRASSPSPGGCGCWPGAESASRCRRSACRIGASVSRATSSSTFTANLNTACPSICRNGRPTILPPHTLPGTERMSGMAAVGVQRARDARPAARPARSTTAPAPSPNSTQVAAIVPVEDAREHLRARRRARCGPAPARTKLSATRERIDEAAAHRLHVECGASAHAELGLQQARSARETHVGRRGRDDDEIDVAGGRCPAASSAARLASSARSLAVWASAAMWRWRIPVRETIHSSVVSTRCASSSIGEDARRQIAAGADDARVVS